MEELVSLLLARQVPDGSILVVGIDGRSGAGKSTLSSAVRDRLGAPEGDGPAVTVIDGDGFYAGGSGATWDRRTPAGNLAAGFDWRGQRRVLRELRDDGVAEWHRFDWESDRWDDDDAPREPDPTVARATGLVVLEGVYSCRPELHDLLDLRVLLDPPVAVRRERLRRREGDAFDGEWDRRWSGAEDHYFGHVMTPARFDLVLTGP